MEVSKSRGQPALQLHAPKKGKATRRSGSLESLAAPKPRRTLKRLNRPDKEMSLIELSAHVNESALLDKRKPRELSLSNIDRWEGEYLPSSAFNSKLKKATILKPSVLEKVMLTRYTSDRQSLLIRCVPDSVVKCPDDDLRLMFNKGIFNEDNDTDESTKMRGVTRNFAALKSGLRSMRLEKRRDQRWKSSLRPPYGAYFRAAGKPADCDEITHLVVKKRKGHEEDAPPREREEDSPSLESDLQVLGKGKPKSSLDDYDLEQLVEFDSGEKEKEASSSNRSKSNSMQEERKSPNLGSPDMEEERALQKPEARPGHSSEPRRRSSSIQKKVKQF